MKTVTVVLVLTMAWQMLMLLGIFIEMIMMIKKSHEMRKIDDIEEEINESDK